MERKYVYEDDVIEDALANDDVLLDAHGGFIATGRSMVRLDST